MSLEQYRVARDHFEVDEASAAQLAFPCNVCRHRHGSDRAEPCRSCDHNANAVPAPTHLERLLAAGRALDW
ncbi:hypothetical protein E4T66_18500 [Sinimarinibacterium sp. CAU 1509]|uniref:hypothetical protein n=1 Tax=Sinimarinibacterium sp. CAU 1509 TaxID=2562283 RepID=UPI0010AB65E0|nr:hypothetical protein [Sinimarinibacterium sp. CAU 1509]TJY57398.1 hypothetical protein E4T66_18500 [Sinimarinibacterium sp. CAU 1509]